MDILSLYTHTDINIIELYTANSIANLSGVELTYIQHKIINMGKHTNKHIY